MDRRRLALCAGTLVGVILGPAAGYVTVHSQPSPAERAPLPLSVAASDVRMLSGWDRPDDVVPAGLIEPAVPPTIKKRAAATGTAASPAAKSASNSQDTPPAPQAAIKAPLAAEQPQQSLAPVDLPAARLMLAAPQRRSTALTKPATIDAAPAAPAVPARVAAKVAEPVPAVDSEPEPKQPASQFNILGPARNSRTADRAKPKTPFVTGAIEPARPPIVPPKMPLTVEPATEPQTADIESTTEPQVADSPADAATNPAAIEPESSPIEIGKLVESQPEPVPTPESVAAPSQETTPIEPAPTPASRVTKKLEPAPAPASESKAELAQDRPTAAPIEAAPAPTPVKDKVSEGSRADALAAEPAKTPEPQPTAPPAAAPEPTQVADVPQSEPKQAAPKLAPAPLDLAPAPTVQPAPETLAQEQPVAPAEPSDPPVTPGNTDQPKSSDNSAKLAIEPAPQAPAMMPLAKDEGARLPNIPQSELPWSKAAKRSPELVAAIKRADALVMHGYELASRGASYAARSEFVAAIKTIAQAHDMEDGSRRHSKAAAAGLTALQEAGDFMRLAQSLNEVDIARIVVPHSTPVLKEADNSDLSPMAAAQSYYSYAQEQLAAAVAQEVVGSMALYSMGKVAVISGKSAAQSPEGSAQGMALYRAALIADGKNYRAANELGVLLAQNGQYELARDLLIRSVAVSPQVTTWKNLATVHARNGERNLAERAHQQALALQKQGRPETPTPAVQWVDAATFASTSAASENLPPAAPAAQTAKTKPAATPAPAKPPVNVAKKSIADWLKVSPRRQ